MKIELRKFGTTLTSRQLGREALSAFEPVLAQLKADEKIEIDFEGVNTFSPSWGDEFITPLVERYSGRVIFIPSANLSVKLTLELLESTSGKKFEYEK